MLKLTKGETAPRPNVKTQLTVQARQKSVATSTPKEQPREKTGSASASYRSQTTEEKGRQRTPVSDQH